MWHHRKTARKPGHDYTAGSYLVTVCAFDRACLFGDVVDGTVSLSDVGRIAEDCWSDVPDHFQQTSCDAFVIMPNHIHGILHLRTSVRVGARHGAPVSLGQIVNKFKGAVTNRVRRESGTRIFIWQRDFHDRIIRTKWS
jgi:REP-associated tyrosine transposase